ncbi:MAG: thioredoxin domain-containing protein [Saprospiraceae bacterium]
MENGSYVATLTDANFEQMVKNASGLRVAYFTAAWCGTLPHDGT